MLDQLLLQPRNPALQPIFLFLNPHQLGLQRRAFLSQPLELRIRDRDLSHDLSHLLIDPRYRRLDLVARLRQLLILPLSCFQIPNGIESRPSDVMESSREGTFAIVLVSVESDRVQVVIPSVGSRDLESLTDDRRTESLLEGGKIFIVEPQLVDPVRSKYWSAPVSSALGVKSSHRDSLVRLRIFVFLDVESIQRHEGHSTTLVLNHPIENPGSRFVRVHHDLEETRTECHGGSGHGERKPRCAYEAHLVPAVTSTAVL